MGAKGERYPRCARRVAFTQLLGALLCGINFGIRKACERKDKTGLCLWEAGHAVLFLGALVRSAGAKHGKSENIVVGWYTVCDEKERA
jgi:hypothetical protein